MDPNSNSTIGHDDGRWNSSPAWKMPGWFEPVLVATILFFACYFTRRKRVSLFTSYQPVSSTSSSPFLTPLSERGRLLDDNYHHDRSTTPDYDDSAFESEDTLPTHTKPAYPPKRRSCCGLTTVYTPNTSQFAHNWHSRVLNKFPFLMEMFYWILTYAIYQLSRVASGSLRAPDEVWARAQAHGISILAAEDVLGLPKEIDVQRWFMQPGHNWMLTVLNRAYALIHIPGTVGFIAWYYACAPGFRQFARVRRTLTLANWIAFVVFALWPCMPPRYLPEEFGFVDTVRREGAESVWMGGKFVNSLAAMPSMHFGYSFIIGLTLIYHSEVLRCIGFAYGADPLSDKVPIPPRVRQRGLLSKVVLFSLGLAYPTLILTAIVATANHYWLDAFFGGVTACTAFLFNRILCMGIPAEDWFLWLLRAEKPRPRGWGR